MKESISGALGDTRRRSLMPKDPEAVAEIGEAFNALLAFGKIHAKVNKKAFEKKVKDKLEEKGATMHGYKKALQVFVEQFAQNVGIFHYA